MTVTALTKDPTALTMTLVAEFDATVDQVWTLWENPRLLERWWGPPTHPATVVAHDLTVGGRIAYYMTGPDGERYHGWWRVNAADAPHRLEVEDGFADADGNPDPNLPTTTFTVTIEDLGSGRTRMTLVSHFASTEVMEQLAAMGMEEGIRQAVGQIDAILAELP